MLSATVSEDNDPDNVPWPALHARFLLPHTRSTLGHVADDDSFASVRHLFSGDFTTKMQPRRPRGNPWALLRPQ